MNDESALIDQLEELLGVAGSDPVGAIERAEKLMQSNPAPGVVARARRVTGLAAANLGDLHRARADLDAALEAAMETADATVVGEVQVTRAGILAWSGEPERSLDAIDAAFDALDGTRKAMAQAQRGGIHYRLGNFALARLDLDESIGALDASGEMMWLAHAMTNRGLLNAYEGDVAAARADLTAAKAAYAGLAHRSSMAQADQNLGWLALRSGDFPAALNFLDEAEQAFVELGMSLGQLWSDRAEALLAAHLVADAKRVALKAAEELRRNGLQASYADAVLQAAQAALLANDAESAVETARRARTLMEEQGRTGWAAFAEYLVMRGRSIDGDLSSDDLPGIKAAVAALDKAGLKAEAVHARLLAAAVATEAGDYVACRQYLTQASAARHEGPVELRAQGWVAVARLRLHAEDRRGAASAARAGIAVLDEYQAALGGTTARLHISGHGAELAAIGLRLALESGSPRRLFRWMELTRAGALRSKPSGHTDMALTSHLMQFREADEELRRAILNGEATRAMSTRRLELQEKIRDVALRARADASRRLSVPLIGEIMEKLGDSVLVEFGETEDGRLIAVRLAGGRARKFDIGSMQAVRSELDSLTIALRGLAGGTRSETSQGAARAVVAAAATRLDELIARPLGLGGEKVVLVPIGLLYGVPWSLLPSLERTPVVVSPSAALWAQRAGTAPANAFEASVIAGPRLEHAAAEVERVAAIYSRSVELLEPHADVAARAINGATIAHVACHGSFRADNPLFSSLEMKDGPLTIYDLEALELAPHIMVLSACDAGANSSSSGHEVMGLATALLGQGTRSVIANVGLVPDQLATIDLMVGVHRGLSRGLAVSEALGLAFPDLDYENHDSIAARAFVAFGA